MDSNPHAMSLLLSLPLLLAQQEPAETLAVEPAATTAPARIQWFGTLDEALAEAKRTNRPLLMTAAAPSCRGIAGKW